MSDGFDGGDLGAAAGFDVHESRAITATTRNIEENNG
jgi:hypothetical protein